MYQKNLNQQIISLNIMRKTQIAVIGYNEDWCTGVAKNIAYETEKEIANSGSVLIYGQFGGVMEAGCKGTKDNQGLAIGIFPQDYMKQFDEGLAKLDPKFQKDKANLSVNNSTFLKRISTDACVTSYTQTGMFGHLLSAEDQEKFVTASFVKLMMEEKNKLIKQK